MMSSRMRTVVAVCVAACVSACIAGTTGEEESTGGIETLRGALEAEGLIEAPACDEPQSWGDEAAAPDPTVPEDTCEPAEEEGAGLGGCTCWAINRLKGWVWSRYSGWGCSLAWTYAYNACYRASDYGICSYYGCE